MSEQQKVEEGFEQGKVIWFSEGKGYGFIRPDGTEGENDVYVHFTGIETSPAKRRNLLEGQRVQYIPVFEQGRPRRIATQVKVVSQ